MIEITTWGQLDSSWIGKTVVVRWEDPSEPMFDGGPSGIPHEFHGRVYFDGLQPFMRRFTDGVRMFNVPEQAHVQEVAA